MSTIKQLDLLAPFEVWEVPFGHSVIKFFKPLVLTPVPLPDDPEEPSRPGENDYALIERPELNISVFANTRDELEEFVFSEIRFIWRHTVLAPDNTLDQESIMIKRNFLAVAEVADG